MGAKTEKVSWNQVMKWEIASNASKWLVLNHHGIHLSCKIYSRFTKRMNSNRVYGRLVSVIKPSVSAC